MAVKEQESKSLWLHAWDSLISDKMTLISMAIVFGYSVLALLSASGLIVADWAAEVGDSYAPPSSEHLFGLDIFGRSVLSKTVKATEIAMSVGLVTGLFTMVIGVTLGAIAGYYGGKIDEVLVWFYTTVSSVPSIMLLISIAFIVGKGILAVYLSLGLTSWTSLFRLIRGEFIRHKDREYVQAATAIGGGDFRKIFKHILPNVLHIVIINFSLQFQFAIKSEVILSYLGLGVQGVPSWGTMINDAKLELARGNWWQLAAATAAMMVVVLAFNILGDSLRDALDPKLKGK
ncbi:MAG: ABC transporter permease [Halobacteriovoraceae bacterium]|jgi:peptide/nickel transport system permease protein|nr:ABC transporter permease [Halobacteriovoraceae bacterium]